MKIHLSPGSKIKFTIVLAAASALAAAASAQVLTTESFAISSGAGGSGGAQTSDMIFSDGTSWSGGAVGLQGASGFNNLSGHTAAANVSFKYNLGATVDSLNNTYGAGNWTVANTKLTFQYTLYANNSRFNAGAGGFNIYWVGNDNWTQGTANPAYATSESALAAWAGSDALLGSEYYNWTTPSYTGTYADLGTSAWVTDKTGARQSTLSYGLGLDSSFVSDILSASASSDPNLSLYLMPTSDSLGLCIFTGGGGSLPTLTFDVVAAPEPSAMAMSVFGLAGFVAVRRWKNQK